VKTERGLIVILQFQKFSFDLLHFPFSSFSRSCSSTSCSSLDSCSVKNATARWTRWHDGIYGINLALNSRGVLKKKKQRLITKGSHTTLDRENREREWKSGLCITTDILQNPRGRNKIWVYFFKGRDLIYIRICMRGFVVIGVGIVWRGSQTYWSTEHENIRRYNKLEIIQQMLVFKPLYGEVLKEERLKCANKRLTDCAFTRVKVSNAC